MNITYIGEALHDLRPAVSDLIALLEEVKQQKPQTLPHDPGFDSDINLLEDTTYLLERLRKLLKQQDEIHPSK